MDDIIKEFLIESKENLDQLDQDFVALEKDPSNQELLSSIFRVIHTIKGTCGFLEFINLEQVTHAGENLLSLLRDGKIMLNPELTDALLSMVDAVRTMIGIIEETQKDGNEAYEELVNRLNKLCELPESSSSTETVIKNTVPATLLQEPEIKQLNNTPEQQPDSIAAIPPVVVSEPIKTIVEHISAANETDTKNTSAISPENESSATASKKISSNDTSIRVEVGLLDRLMNLVGELVLTRNQILQFTSKQNDATLHATSQRLNLITRELQEGAMKTRMQPIYNIWNKFPRVVRDLSQSLGKKVEVFMEGKDTEIDKSIIESIKDPLTHLVRNSIDHGIESPEVRLKNGKNETGKLILKAYHESGMVNIEITDDGGGINVSRIKEKALERGLMTKDQLSLAKDNEIMNLIFMPGFSTAEAVSHVSGRGVGMDVVKTNIEKVGGTVDIQSTLGKGSTIKIKIPLTLAIIPGLVVTCDNDRYVIPQVNLVELVLLNQEELKSSIEFIHNTPVYRLRGQLLPIVALKIVLGLDPRDSETFFREQESISIVVLQANESQFGLVVDTINDTQEIVVKPLSKLLKGLSAFAGATIMGDGLVALILDTLGIASLANMTQENTKQTKLISSNAEHFEDVAKQSLLLFELAADGLMAVPLDLIARLEEFRLENIEYAGTQEVVQYDEQVMPLIRLSNVLSTHSSTERIQSDRLQVLVFKHQDQNVGLIVEKILDIVDDAEIEYTTLERNGVIGSAIIHGKITEIIDIQNIVSNAMVYYQPKKQQTDAQEAC